jgi:hypothetical protein
MKWWLWHRWLGHGPSHHFAVQNGCATYIELGESKTAGKEREKLKMSIAYHNPDHLQGISFQLPVFSVAFEPESECFFAPFLQANSEP